MHISKVRSLTLDDWETEQQKVSIECKELAYYFQIM